MMILLILRYRMMGMVIMIYNCTKTYPKMLCLTMLQLMIKYGRWSMVGLKTTLVLTEDSIAHWPEGANDVKTEFDFFHLLFPMHLLTAMVPLTSAKLKLLPGEVPTTVAELLRYFGIRLVMALTQTPGGIAEYCLDPLLCSNIQQYHLEFELMPLPNEYQSIVAILQQ